MSHARQRLDPIIHAPVRFSILAALAAADELEFAFVRDTVEITDSALSKQLTTLHAADYVQIRKGAVGRRPRTWIKLTPTGRRAWEAHLLALQAIAGPNQHPTPAPAL